MITRKRIIQASSVPSSILLIYCEIFQKFTTLFGNLRCVTISIFPLLAFHQHRTFLLVIGCEYFQTLLGWDSVWEQNRTVQMFQLEPTRVAWQPLYWQFWIRHLAVVWTYITQSWTPCMQHTELWTYITQSWTLSMQHTELWSYITESWTPCMQHTELDPGYATHRVGPWVCNTQSSDLSLHHKDLCSACMTVPSWH